MRKKKMFRILGIAITTIMALSLVVATALPVSADEEAWSDYTASDLPGLDAVSDFFMGPNILYSGPIAKAVDDTLYLYVEGTALPYDDLFISTDAGRTWEATGLYVDFVGAGAVVAIACYGEDADTLYVADATNVYKSTDAGDIDSWKDLGSPVAGTEVITCLDVGYADEDPHLYVGTADPGADGIFDNADDVALFGEVHYYRDAPFASVWTDLDVCGPDAGGAVDDSDVWGIGCSPDFANDTLTVAVISEKTVNTTLVTANEAAGIGLTAWDDAVIQNEAAAAFTLINATDPVFVEDFDVDDAYELFVGIHGPVHTVSGVGGVYRITGMTNADDFLLDDIDDEIASLGAVGTLGASSLLAGALADTTVERPAIWYSTDDGDSWDETDKAPAVEDDPADAAGVAANLVIVDDDFADTGIAWCATFQATAQLIEEGSVSLTTDFGATWNGISMLDTDMAIAIHDIDFAPEYGTSDAPMFTVTEPTGALTRSVWKFDGSNWERVFLCRDVAAVGLAPNYDLDLVQTSPDYTNDSTLFIADSGTPLILRSDDGGATFAELIREPLAAITAWVVLDDDTVITADAAGNYYKTTRYGRRIWDTDLISAAGNTITDLAVSPNIGTDDTLLAGDILSLVYISEDLGDAWDEVSASDVAGFVTAVNPTYVAFDPGYASNAIFYAASDDVVARCTIDTAEDWGDQVFEDFVNAANAPGLTTAVGPGGIVVSIDGAEGGVDFGTLYVADATAGAGMWRCLNPTDAIGDTDFENPIVGLVGAETFAGISAAATVRNLELVYGSNVLYAIDTTLPIDIWTYEDTLAAAILPDTPADTAGLADTDRVLFQWDALNADTVAQYDLEVYEDADWEDLVVAFEAATPADPQYSWSVGNNVLAPPDPGSKYYWRVRVNRAQPVASRWSEGWWFTTKVGAVAQPVQVRPLPGADEVILSPTFNWLEVVGATSYEIDLASDAGFAELITAGTSPINVWAIDTELNYSTVYYWRVRGISATGAPAGDWIVSIFSTMEEPEAAISPVEIVVPPAPEVTIEQPTITPNWIYAIIAIGATLAVLVIVLVVKTGAKR